MCAASREPVRCCIHARSRATVQMLLGMGGACCSHHGATKKAEAKLIVKLHLFRHAVQIYSGIT